MYNSIMVADRRILWHLRRVPLLEGVSVEMLNQLGRGAQLVEARRRHVLYLPGDPGSSVYLLHSGRVKVSKVTRDGKELALRYYRAGEIVGETCLLDAGPRQEMAEVVEPAILVEIDRAVFESVGQENAVLAWRFAMLLCERRRELEYRLEFLLFKDVAAKLAELLLKLTDEHGKDDPRGTMVGIRITHQEMANLIGSTRETVSLTVSQFRRKGLVQSDGRKVIVSDREGLRSVCG